MEASRRTRDTVLNDELAVGRLGKAARRKFNLKDRDERIRTEKAKQESISQTGDPVFVNCQSSAHD